MTRHFHDPPNPQLNGKIPEKEYLQTLDFGKEVRIAHLELVSEGVLRTVCLQTPVHWTTFSETPERKEALPSLSAPKLRYEG